ncbi:MAG: Replicative DNA helicase [Verrucomicrobia subdivision 3 bacterium]|nr:Replicative DNA helicase [Limisphaerales bacterium]MCS1416646.1 Replicative DNA helicase [Limisphaerales bacterium]
MDPTDILTETPPTTDLKRTPRQKAKSNPPPLADRLPPHSTEAEMGVLGCILLDPNENMGLCIEKFKGGAAVFYDLRHRELYEQLVELYDAKRPIDLVTLSQHLKDRNLLDAVGGITYLNTLMDAVPSAANLSYYLDIVREKAILRKAIQVCTSVVGRVHEAQGAVDQLLDEIERDVLKISQDRIETIDRSMKALVTDAISTLESYHANQGALTGLSSGFPDLDKMTYGLHPGEMIVIAARPSMGKTSLAMNIAEGVALDQNCPVGVFSLEMTAESLALRMLCSRARLNLRSARDGFFAERDFPRLTQAAAELAKAPLVIDDTPGLSILQLRARARRMAQQHGIKLLVIDYLQLLNSTSRRVENRQQEIADISNGVKALAKELNVPIIILSQLNREIERDKNRKPRLSDLRESGAIEQDADIVGLLYKASNEEEEEDQLQTVQEAAPIHLLIAKQRNGPTGDVPLIFLKGFTRYESAAKVNTEDIPTEN